MKGRSVIAMGWWMAFTCPALAQTTVSNLWLFDLSYDDQQPVIEHSRKLTDTNSYTNQPYFFGQEQALYYTQSYAAGTARQTDIMKFDISRGFHRNLTHTAESEYSPTPLPEKNGFSAIRVDKQNKQWLWIYTHKENYRFTGLEPIGYHVWVNSDEALAFVLGKTHTLQRLAADLSPTVIDSDIGPSLWAIPNTQLFSYTKNPAPAQQPWTLMSYDPQAEKTSLLVTLPEDAYYMAWAPDAKALTLVDSQVYAWDFNEPGTDVTLASDSQTANSGDWQPWLNLKTYCPEGGSRLHISQDARQLAVVCNESR